MEELTRLMQLIDSSSDTIKEGHYLEMCTSIQSLYHKIATRDPVIVREWRYNAVRITELQDFITLLDRCMRSLKYLRNITESVKIEAIIHKAGELGIILLENTIDALRASGVDIPNERDLYREYIVKRNVEIADERMGVQQELLDKHAALENVRRRQRWLVTHHNL